MLKLVKFETVVIEMKKDKMNSLNLVRNAIKNLDVWIELKNIKFLINGSGDIFIGDYKWQLEALTNIIKNCV